MSEKLILKLIIDLKYDETIDDCCGVGIMLADSPSK